MKLWCVLAIDGASPFDGTELKPIDASSGSDIFAVPPFSLKGIISDDEPGVWGADAKLKMKVGVVSVTVKQHTEGRVENYQWMLDIETVLCAAAQRKSWHPS